MPAKVKVRILAGRNLPVMDKSSDASDAFVEVKLGNTTYKTEVYRRSLNPFWNSEWFRFEVSDQELQDEPLQIRIMDYDTYSANDAIGKVYINLNPLLVNPGRSMSGWLPIYDTLHGIRGEINCMVKVNLFADNNRYRHSSCGVRFFFSDIPNGYKCDAILGFVDELLVNDDPEYQWIDKIRTPRASNEARQTLFTKLSGEVQRKLGLKAEIFGGNAVIGYKQSFDLEGGSGIVGRGIGTAVVLSRIGYPYEGIISPIHFNNQHVPYPYPPEVLQVIQQDRNNISHNILHHKSNPYPERHLVHSVSADYFYEVPSERLDKKVSANSQPSKLTQLLKTNRALSGDDSDASEYEDCEEVPVRSDVVAKSSDDDDDDTSEDSDISSGKRTGNKAVIVSSPDLSSSQKTKRFPNLNKSLNLMSSIDIKNSNLFGGNSESRLNANSILKKLSKNNENLSKKLSTVTKPMKSASGLTKLISFRKYHNQANQISQVNDAPIFSHSNNSDEQRIRTKSTSEDSSQTVTTVTLSQQRSTTSSKSTSSNAPVILPSTSITTATTNKRRRDQSQSASLDDALSIIEEKLDDDDHLNASPSKSQKQLTKSVSKQRQIIRAKEIDLNDENEPSVFPPMKGLGTSSADDDDADEANNSSATTLSTSTLEAKTSGPLDSQISSSSPSTSMLTDETIKMKSTPTKQPKLAAQLSSPISIKPPYVTLRRSDTDLAVEKYTDITGTSPIPSSSANIALARSQSSYQNHRPVHNLDPRLLASSQQQQHKQQQGGSNANFVQSVRAIKAQQHLLQNMIKQQNKCLVVSSSNKARNAFMYPNRVHQSEYPFVTLKLYPENLIQCTGGVVSVHSVKLLDHIINDEESETRDIWWTELRKEIRSHAKALNCNTILGYSETSKVLGDVCVLSALGTAAVLKPIGAQQIDQVGDYHQSISHHHQQYHHQQQQQQQQPAGYQGGLQTLKIPRLPSPPPLNASMPTALSVETGTSTSFDQGVGCSEPPLEAGAKNGIGSSNSKSNSTQKGNSADQIDCSFCHTPLHCADSINSLTNCTICESSKVPDVLLLTIEPPKNLNIVSGITLVQARVCRAKRDSHGEANAKEIGDALPFLEYELHRQLFTKLKFKGMNCLYNLSIDVSIGENMLTGTATGTGCFVLGLPLPDPPQISAGKGIKASRLHEIQRLIELSTLKNRESLGLEEIDSQLALYRQRLKMTTANTTASTSAAKTATAAVSVPTQQTAAATTTTAASVVAQTSAEEFDESRRETASLLVPSAMSFESGSESNASGRRSATRLRATASGDQHQHHHHHHHHHRHRHRHQHRSASAAAASGSAAPADNLINLLTDENNIVLEVDDNEDADIITQLIDSDIPEGYLICNSESIPTINQSSITSINMFTQVMRTKLTGVDQFAQQFDWILQALFVKLRRSLPCCLTNINFVVDLPESQIVQISVTGCLLGLRSSPSALMAEASSESSNGYLLDNTECPAAAASLQQSSGGPGGKVRLIGQTSTSASAASSTSLSSSSESSSSSSSSSSSASPSSTSSRRSAASSSSTSAQSVRRSDAPLASPAATTSTIPTTVTTTTTTSSMGSELKSLTKKLSNSNIAALLSGKSSISSSSDKKRSSQQQKESADNIELAEAPRLYSTKDTIEAVKEELRHTRLGNSNVSQRRPVVGRPNLRSVRAVFKKQQTYPGATSPAISGQDKLLPVAVGGDSAANNATTATIIGSTTVAANTTTTTTTTGQSSGSSSSSAGNATRRATIILNKVKQPLRELGSNFNSAPSANSEIPLNSSVGLQQSTSVVTSGQAGGSTKLTAAKSHGSGTGGLSAKKSSGNGQSAVGQTINGGDGSTTANAASTSVAAAAAKQTSKATADQRHALNSSIDITSLSYIPGAKEYHYLGNLSFSFVRETNSVRENGGLNGFIHCFLMEVYAIVRAHVSALGGNAFLSFRLQQSCIFYHSNKNQAQCLISVAGDAVQVTL